METVGEYGFKMIHVEDFEKTVQKECALLIDLREEQRYLEGHIFNARNFPFKYINSWRNEIPEGVNLIMYCEHGNQSLLAARKLSGRKGTIYTLIGGYQEFVKQNGKILC